MIRFAFLIGVILSVTACCNNATADDRMEQLVASALKTSGGNRPQLEAALKGVSDDQREGMRFLIAYMPDRDLKSLKTDFLIENVRYAYQAWNDSPWKKSIPKDVFLNNVLPYANVSERRDNWRKDFREQFGPIVKNAKTPSEAAALLNQKIFPLLKVRYSAKRRRADQGPKESIKSGLASCSGLAVLLIDACRSVGVPARFVGTPLWSDRSGNHSWVEIWDNGWHFTGAAEPSGNALDRAWFIGRASKARGDDRMHAIYAVSYKRTPITFPLVWDRNAKVYAVNVTSRYTRNKSPLAEGVVEVHVRAMLEKSNDRVAAKLQIVDAAGKTVFEGTSHDERFDSNDHVMVRLKKDGRYELRAEFQGRKTTHTIDAAKADSVITLRLK